VLDFSVAKVPIARTTPAVDQAKTDLIVGTPTYMSPEQALGRPANELSDQYSIGGLLYRCLTGWPPQGVLTPPRELRPEMPAGLQPVVMRALETEPEKRFGTVHDLGHALVTFGSVDARERWLPYYEAPPRVIDPTTTGSLASSSPWSDGTGAPWSSSITIEVRPTVARKAPTTAAGAPSPARSEIELATITESPSTISARLGEAGLPSPVGRGSEGVESKLEAEPDRLGVEIDDLPSQTMKIRGRGRFGAALAVVAVVVVVVTFVNARSTKRQARRAPVVVAPSWIHDVTPRQPAAPVGLDARLARQQAPAAPAPPPTPGTLAAPRPRKRHHHAARVWGETIEYGAGGAPILP
jgi:serine/threonine-protein kinase